MNEKRVITQFQGRLLRAIAEHGPLTFSEAAAATQSIWVDVDDALRSLQRSGHVLVFGDERVRLTVLGRRCAKEVAVA